MALIRCKKCGNLVSDKASACPICGEEVAAAAPAAPKTLNDILAERGATPVTLNDRLQQQGEAQPVQPAGPAQPARPVAPEREPAQEAVRESVSEPAPQRPTEPAPARNAVRDERPRVMPVVEPIVNTGRSHDDYDRPRNDYDRRAYDDRRTDDGGADYPADSYADSEELERMRKSTKGYRIALVILILIIIPLAFFFTKYVNKVREVERNAELITSAKQMLEEENSQLEADAQDLVAEFENMKIQNDTMLVKYQQATAMLEQLQKEKTYNYNQINKYKRELATLKDVMKGYLRQIDSLNNINKHLQAENISYKKEISTAQLRADVAEEKAEELNSKVRIGSVIRARGIAMSPLNAKSKSVSRVRNAERLRVDFELTANELAEPGQKTVYVRIISPDGYLLSPDNVITFSYEGDALLASAERTVDYENNDVPVSIFYDYSRKGLAAGTYKVQLYTEGRLIGENDIYLR
ncbi:MAG: hypothetical protein J6K38_06495 [Alistipes sp.]|nr:hypothetical protein [Alistipes sp.]